MEQDVLVRSILSLVRSERDAGEFIVKTSFGKSGLTKIQAVMIAVVIIAATIVPAYFLSLSYMESAPFSLNVITRPASFGEIVYTPGQRCLFLVTVEESQNNTTPAPVVLSATSPGCEVTIFPQSISPGQVAELTVMPTQANIDKNVSVTLQGERQGLKQTKTVNLEIIEWEDTLEPEAASMRDRFVPWFSTNQPQLGITNDTVWTGTIVNPRILVVMHYMFLSEDWEMYVTWHVMVSPYDWTRIYLRPRFNQTAPTYAFEISSIQAQVKPVAIEVPDWV
jgi:hypothetical protein